MAPGGGKEASAITQGINTGWKVWLVLLVAYLVLGLPLRLSLVLSLLSGVCSGLIVAWWQSSETSPTEKPPSEPLSPEAANPKKKP